MTNGPAYYQFQGELLYNAMYSYRRKKKKKKVFCKAVVIKVGG